MIIVLIRLNNNGILILFLITKKQVLITKIFDDLISLDFHFYINMNARQIEEEGNVAWGIQINTKM